MIYRAYSLAEVFERFDDPHIIAAATRMFEDDSPPEFIEIVIAEQARTVSGEIKNCR